MKVGTRSFAQSSVRISHFRPEGLPPELYDEVRLISHVETQQEHRRKGHASRAMRKLIAEADHERVALLLEVKPFGDEPIDRNALECWYTRLGFARIQDEPCVMLRMPRQ